MIGLTNGESIDPLTAIVAAFWNGRSLKGGGKIEKVSVGINWFWGNSKEIESNCIFFH